jgi:hypothetical protein
MFVRLCSLIKKGRATDISEETLEDEQENKELICKALSNVHFLFY